jgi:hypothetical protein
LSVEAGGQLDLANNALIVDYAADSPVASIRTLILSGYDGGTWAGDGIASSTAAGDPSKAVGYAEAGAALLVCAGVVLATRRRTGLP